MAWRRFRRNRGATAAVAVLAVIAVTAVLAPLLPLDDPAATRLADRLLPPLSDGHLLGTDHLGRDLLARLVWGTRLSLAVALVATAVAAVVGSTIGLVAGYRSGVVDSVLMRSVDMLLAFPYLLLALAIVAALGPGLLNALIAIAIVNIPFFARTARGATIAQVGRDYVAAARISGLGPVRIVCSEILPNVLPAIVIAMATTTAWMILETAGLSFLGLGAQPPAADLGSMLAEGRRVVLAAPHVATIPGVAVLVIVLCVNLTADAVRDGLDPRLAGGQRTRPVALTRAWPAPADWATAGSDLSRPGHGRQGSALLLVDDLAVRFSGREGAVDAVDGVSFALARGERIGLAGASGSGKSVLALTLLRLVPSPPAEIVRGEARLEGEDLVGAPLSRMQEIRGGRIGYIAQDPAGSFNPLLPVGPQVSAVLRRHHGIARAAARERVEAMLARMRFSDPGRIFAAWPHQLSGGQLQRVAIARAIIGSPTLIIADEPTTALDVQTQVDVLDLLGALQRESGASLLFISHDLTLIARMCQRLLVMRNGRVVEEGKVDAIMKAPREGYTRDLIAAIPHLRAPG